VGLIWRPGDAVTRRSLTNASYSPAGAVCTAFTQHRPLHTLEQWAFVLRERWFDVSALEFEAFLRDYPRPLDARPPLKRVLSTASLGLEP
jgi:hypothetical protein